MLGTLNQTPDGRHVLRFERHLAHPPAKVWRALTETEALRAWFVQILDYDRSNLDFAEGAALTFVPKDADFPIGHGTVVRSEPPCVLEYTWDGEVLRWELEPEDSGCRLIFTVVVDDRGTAVATAPGWHAELDGLAAVLDGTTREHDWAELIETYARAIG